VGGEFAARIGCRRRFRGRVAVWWARLRHRRSIRRGVWEHPVEWAQSPKCLVVHADDGDWRSASFGGRQGSAVGEARTELEANTAIRRIGAYVTKGERHEIARPG